MFSKNTWPVSISTTPAVSTFTITDVNGKEVSKGNTPATINLKSGRGFFKPGKYTITISSEGYTTVTIPVKAKLNGWYFGNLVYGGVIGMLIVDPASGAMYRIKDPKINQALSPVTSDVPSLKIMNLCDVPAEWNNELVKVN